MLHVIRKALADEQAAIQRLLVRQESTVRRAFKAFLDGARSEEVLRNVRQVLERGNVEAALNMIDPYVARFGNSLTQVFTDTAIGQSGSLLRQLGAGYVAIGFDPTYPRAAALMRENRLDLITDFTRQQRDATRTALVDAFNTGEGPRVAAKAFRDSIGLTRSQLKTVNNYRDLLETNNEDALDRELRDRRSDTLIERTFEEGDLLDGDQIERMVGRYTDNMLNLRAETIARTETIKIANQARHEATQQIMDQVGFKPEQVIRTWMATQDERTRDSHAALDGQTRGLDEPFETEDGVQIMYPGDPDAPLDQIINCRCVLSVEIKDSEGDVIEHNVDDQGDDEG